MPRMGYWKAFTARPCGKECVALGHVSWVFPRYDGRCHFFFHLIRECNTSSKQFSPNWPEMLKPNPERIPLPLSLRGTLSYPALILLKYKIFTQKSWVCLTLHFSVFKNKIKIYSWYVLRCFSIRDLKKNKIILLNGKLNTREQVVWK